MATAIFDGVHTHYEVVGKGPPILMFSPGGFDASAAKWSDQGSYRDLRLVENLSRSYTCITFDRSGSGRSGAHLERATWSSYARQGQGLLDHLGIGRAHFLGGCVGCSIVLTLALADRRRARSLVLLRPAGGARYRIRQERRFAEHLEYVEGNGLSTVVDVARSHDHGFSKDTRVGPWAGVIRAEDEFADRFVSQDPEDYRMLVSGMVQSMFDRDTVPGPEPEDLFTLNVPALVVPGQDNSHPRSAARYLEECLPVTEYWDAPREETEKAVLHRILSFLSQADRSVEV